MSPPTETGATDDRARIEIAVYITKLVKQLQQFNTCVSPIWTREGWRLLSEYQRSGEARHLDACTRHVNAIRQRLLIQ
jgi:hypothetical protein